MDVASQHKENFDRMQKESVKTSRQHTDPMKAGNTENTHHKRQKHIGITQEN